MRRRRTKIPQGNKTISKAQTILSGKTKKSQNSRISLFPMVNPSVSKRESKPHPSGGGGRGINQFAFFFFLPPFFPPPDGARSTERTNERTNERTCTDHGLEGDKVNHSPFFVGGVVERGCSPPPLPTPFFATSDVCNEGWVAAALRAPCTWVRTEYLQKSTKKIKHFFISSPSEMCFLPSPPVWSVAAKKDLWGKGSLFEERREGKHGQSNKEEEEEGET